MDDPSRRRWVPVAVILALAACNGSAAVVGVDAGTTFQDAGDPDADGSSPDSGAPDASIADAGGPDAGDAGADDAGGPDAGAPDAAGPDAGAPDAGSSGPTLGPCPLFPADNMWNTDISDPVAFPTSARSADYVATIGAVVGLHPDFGAVWQGSPNGIPFVLVPSTQALIDLTFDYADESDPGPYPVPPDAPIEGGPAGDGDRHVLVVETGSCTLYELYNAWPQNGGASWTAGSGAIWHLDQNEVRQAGWTSADAAGLAILPGLVRYDEVYGAKEIRHAVRFTAGQIQHAYVRPASHSDGRAGTDPAAPPMGQRFRLRRDFPVASYPEPLQVIFRAMQTYGLVLADTGGDWYVSGAPDDRWDDDLLHRLIEVTGSDFEAIQMGPIIPY